MKELIIIVYKVNISGFSRQQAQDYMKELMDFYNLKDDIELKSNNYLIREIWLPLGDNDGGQTDVKIIYPITQSYAFSPEVNDLVVDISDRIKNDSTNGFKHQWEKLVRELKLRKINQQYDDSK